MVKIGGRNAVVFSAGYNVYVQPRQSTSLFFSLLAGYVPRATPSGGAEESLFLFSPNAGIDIVTLSRFSYFLRVGTAAIFGSKSTAKAILNAGIGAEWQVF